MQIGLEQLLNEIWPATLSEINSEDLGHLTVTESDF